jgi:fructose-1,6-bisphosphatase I
VEDNASLAQFLERAKTSAADAGQRTDLIAIVCALAGASINIAEAIALGKLAGTEPLARSLNADGDIQLAIDLAAQRLIVDALKFHNVRRLVSEESEQAIELDEEGAFDVAIDPLDGSSNLDTNTSVGTIFSVSPARRLPCDGSQQVAAGFAVYGPRTELILTLGDGVDIFTLDRQDRVYRLTRAQVRIPEVASEYAIKIGNYRHWHAPFRAFFDDCLKGVDDACRGDFNMRWIGSLVGEAYRILARGGLCLYPADTRRGFENGRLRLLYEAHPIAFLMTQAGGFASTGSEPILERSSDCLHERTPLIFGSTAMVERMERLCGYPEGRAEISPLFGHRGLFRV